MADPLDMILPMLRKVPSETKDSVSEPRRGFDAVDVRFDRRERRFDDLRDAENGDPVLGRAAAAEMEDRPEATEKRPATLERRS